MNYLEFANIYDKLIYDVDYNKVVEFINKQKEENQVQGTSLLELGCGTGNITSKLIGYNIIAVDNSEEMLALARKKTMGKRNIRYMLGDIVNLSLAKSFDMVIAVLDVFNYITAYEDLKKVFKNVYSNLKADGLFIFDINSAYKIRDYIGNNVFTDEVEDLLYIWQGSFDEESKVNDYLLTFFQNTKEGLYKRFDEVHRERAYSLEEIIEALDEAGFKDIRVFDSYENKDIEEKSLRLTFVVRKEKDE